MKGGLQVFKDMRECARGDGLGGVSDKREELRHLCVRVGVCVCVDGRPCRSIGDTLKVFEREKDRNVSTGPVSGNTGSCAPLGTADIEHIRNITLMCNLYITMERNHCYRNQR